MHHLATPSSRIDVSGHSLTRGHRAPLRQLKTAARHTAALLLAAAVSCTLATAQTAGVYTVTNIISDGIVPATTMDPGFVDPWGVSGGNTLWINTAVTGFSYVTSVAGAISATIKAIVPPASGAGTGQPTGTVQNTTTSGFVLSNGAKSSFLFSTNDGTISGWNSATVANHAVIQVNNSTKNAVYTDLALLTNTSGSFLLVPNFGQGADVEIYNATFQPATLQGTFTDPNIPTGYAPYAIKVLGTQVFVTYMLRTGSTYQESLGTNTGFVSVFDVNGNFVARAVTGGNLNAPWGVAIAPAGFGIYGGDLLIATSATASSPPTTPPPTPISAPSPTAPANPSPIPASGRSSSPPLPPPSPIPSTSPPASTERPTASSVQSPMAPPPPRLQPSTSAPPLKSPPSPSTPPPH
jgi:uncharacterized protein (TIGR03118 family)